MKFLNKVFTKRFLLFSLVFVFSLGIFLRGGTQVRASFMQSAGINSGTAGNSQTNTWLQFAQSVNSDQSNVTSWSGFPLLAMINHITALIVGYPDANGVIQYQTSGNAVGALGNTLTAMYATTPISSKEYIASIGNSTGLFNISPAYAASEGITFLGPDILKVWSKMRDVVYVLFVVVFVAIGFMIMFRFKINPQTVATVQDSIPKIVFSLILVTLSYAVAGLLVDIVFLGNKFIEQTFLTGTLSGQNAKTWDIFSLISGGFGSYNIFGYLVTAISNLASLFKGDYSSVVNFVIALTLLTTTFQIFFALLTKYVTIILSTIFMPLTILWGTLPGQEDTFPKSFKSFLSAVLCFPAVFFFLTLASHIAKTTGVNFQLQPSLPPFNIGAVKSGAFVAAGVTTAQDIIRALVGLGILMATAKIPQAIDDALEVRPGVAAGTGEVGGALRRIPIIGSFLG